LGRLEFEKGNYRVFGKGNYRVFEKGFLGRLEFEKGNYRVFEKGNYRVWCHTQHATKKIHQVQGKVLRQNNRLITPPEMEKWNG